MNIKKVLIYLLMIIILITISGCTTNKVDDVTKDITNNNKMVVAVSIIPQETFVKSIAGDLVDVVVMIPPGYSPANYQPTPKQITDLSSSKVYFSIGVPTEEANILPKVKDFNKDIKIVPLADKVGEVYPHRMLEDEEGHGDNDEHDDEHNDEHTDDHEHGGRDPHIWLSPKRVKVMIEVIKDELIALDPKNKLTYEKNAKEYIDSIDKVDEEIMDTLKDLEEKSFIIYHPAFAYFADDYGLKMVTIEEDGKQITAKKLQEVINFAKKENIQFIFYQEEFDSHQAETIAKEIGGATVKVSPLAPNYLENLKVIANTFKEVLK